MSKKVIFKHTDAEKYKFRDMLKVGKVYEEVNETEEYIFIKDNSGKVGGYYHDYFEEVK